MLKKLFRSCSSMKWYQFSKYVLAPIGCLFWSWEFIESILNLAAYRNSAFLGIATLDTTLCFFCMALILAADIGLTGQRWFGPVSMNLAILLSYGRSLFSILVTDHYGVFTGSVSATIAGYSIAALVLLICNIAYYQKRRDFFDLPYVPEPEDEKEPAATEAPETEAPEAAEPEAAAQEEEAPEAAEARPHEDPEPHEEEKKKIRVHVTRSQVKPRKVQKNEEQKAETPARRKSFPVVLALLLTSLLLVASVAWNIEQTNKTNEARRSAEALAEELSGLELERDELQKDVDNLSETVEWKNETIDSLSDGISDAMRYKWIRTALYSGAIGYSSENFHASEGIILIGKDDPDYTFTLTAKRWDRVWTTFDGYCALFDVEGRQWENETTVRVNPIEPGVTVIKFRDTKANEEFYVLVFVTE